MKKRFNLTYEVVTEASASNGDAAHRGFLPRTGTVPLYRDNMPKNPAAFTLRQAIEKLFEGEGGAAPVEADSSHLSATNPPRWFTRQQTPDWERPCVSLSLHVDKISPSSALRIARLLGVKVRG